MSCVMGVYLCVIVEPLRQTRAHRCFDLFSSALSAFWYIRNVCALRHWPWPRRGQPMDLFTAASSYKLDEWEIVGSRFIRHDNGSGSPWIATGRHSNRSKLDKCSERTMSNAPAPGNHSYVVRWFWTAKTTQNMLVRWRIVNLHRGLNEASARQLETVCLRAFISKKERGRERETKCIKSSRFAGCRLALWFYGEDSAICYAPRRYDTHQSSFLCMEIAWRRSAGDKHK